MDKEQEIVRRIKDQKGSCPDERDLVAFHEQTLSQDRMKEIFDHVQFCGICQLILERLDRWENLPLEQRPEPKKWSKMEKEFKKRFHSILQFGAEKSHNAPITFLRDLLWRPSLAYLLVLILAYPAYHGLTTRSTTDGRTSDVVSLPVYALPSPLRSSGTLTHLIIPSQTRLFALTFFIPIREESRWGYNLEIQDTSGKTMAKKNALKSLDTLGHFSIACRRSLFSPGRYKIVVQEINLVNHEEGRTFTFGFILSKKEAKDG